MPFYCAYEIFVPFGTDSSGFKRAISSSGVPPITGTSDLNPAINIGWRKLNESCSLRASSKLRGKYSCDENLTTKRGKCKIILQNSEGNSYDIANEFKELQRLFKSCILLIM